jgi:adenylosuccinate lyase
VANIVDGVVVYEKVIEKHIAMELPFMATENILMACVKARGDRQELHEKIREMSMEAGRRVKEEGKGNELIEMIRANPAFEPIHASLDSILHANNFIGRCPQQVDEFIAEEIDPILNKHKDTLVEMDEKIRV